MSRFFSERHAALVPYVPGEQPRDMKYTKLNTNESPFPPSPSVESAVREQVGLLQLYSDPESTALRDAMAKTLGVKPENVLMTNGSDETLNFAFMAFADEKRPLLFPDITYGFYPVIAGLNHIPYREIPLREDFTVNPADYMRSGGVVVLANPNAPTGIPLPLTDIEAIVASDAEAVVIVDEAYVDFGGESAVKLTEKYDNLLVVGTFSKSRSMAGARLGYAVGNAALIADLNTLKYAANPYTVNRMTAAAGIAALNEAAYYQNNCRTIMENRAWTAAELARLGFVSLPSCANFIFTRSDRIGGEKLYSELKKRGVLVRHFTKERISDYNRITIGTREQMEILISAIEQILKELAL